MMYVMAGGQENQDQNLKSSLRKFPTGALWSEGERTSGGHRPLKVVLECGPGPMVCSAPCTLCRRYGLLGTVKDSQLQPFGFGSLMLFRAVVREKVQRLLDKLN